MMYSCGLPVRNELTATIILVKNQQKICFFNLKIFNVVHFLFIITIVFEYTQYFKLFSSSHPSQWARQFKLQPIIMLQ